ncbi:MAG: AIPR family protein [Spirochaetia bacterium]|jgi:hypothetical protein|nr:AIPR family protein [Spirochaetia bacterium]MCI2096152.1 AIPR family protein [Lactococcus lactis]
MAIDFETFLKEQREELAQRRNEMMISTSSPYPYQQVIYCEMAANYLSENGALVGDFKDCYYEGNYRNKKIKIFGYALDDDEDISKGIDIITCIYRDSTGNIIQLTNQEIQKEVTAAYYFIACSLDNTSNFVSQLTKGTSESDLAMIFREYGNECKNIRITVITNCVSKIKSFATQKAENIEISINIFDSDLWYKQSIEGKPQDSIIIDFEKLLGSGLPCVYVPRSKDDEYDYALTAIPGNVIYSIYSKYRDQLLEANVRSFLSTKRVVNSGIKDTLTTTPRRFMAYNNGLVIVADKAIIQNNQRGVILLQLHAAQIVNGGQTTASIYFSKRDNDAIQLNEVRVAAKIIIFNSKERDEEDNSFVSNVSRYSNLQNAIKKSDFEAHALFHINFEKVLKTITCPDGNGKWFYERAAGSFNTYLNFTAKSPYERRRILSKIIPPSRRIQKKTDLSMCIATWDGKPKFAALGGEKCLVAMKNYLNDESKKIDPQYVKDRLAQYIVYRKSFYLLKGNICPQSPSGVRIALLSIISEKYKDRLNLKMVWDNQQISDSFIDQIKIWGKEVYDFLFSHANGKSLGEYAKTEICWTTLKREFILSEPIKMIPELP